MIEPSARHPNGVLEMHVRIPREISRGKMDKILFFSFDFDMTWIQFFQRYNPGLCLYLEQEDYIVHDMRKEDARKHWTLNDTIKDYINSFKMTLSVYKASIAIRTDKMVMGNTTVSEVVVPAQSGPSKDVQPISVAPSKTNVTASSPAADKPGSSRDFTFKVPTAPAGRVAPGSNNFDRDDAASWATSLSQDSRMDDLMQNGVEINMIKPIIVQQLVRHLDNATLLRMKHELQTCLDGGQWLNYTARLPITASALQIIFGVTTSDRR